MTDNQPQTDTKKILDQAAEVLTNDIKSYMHLQTEELSNTFEYIFQLNQATIGKYSELIQEAETLREKSRMLQEQEIGVSSFLSNLFVVEQDITRLEQTIDKLERYCTLLEQKVMNK